MAPAAPPVSKPSDPAIAGPKSLLLLDTKESGNSRARSLDPATLEDLGGREISLDYGGGYTTAVSPDGWTLAAIVRPRGLPANRGGVLHLIDLGTLVVRRTAATFDDAVRQLVFGADGKRLYWVRPGPMAGEPFLNPDPGLYRYDIGSDQVSRVVALPNMFLPEFSGVGIAGDRLAIVGSTLGDPASSAVAEVYVVDLARERLAATLQTGIRAGTVREAGGTQEDVRNVRPGIAWDLPRGRLYVVDADDDRVTVVDLATGWLRGPVVVRPRGSLLDRFLALISSPAAAKAQSSSERRAVVSPDGQRLYVSGIRFDVLGGASPQVTPLGLQVIDTADLTQIGRMDLTSMELSISPDGRRLLAVTNRFEPDGWKDYELKIIDAHSLTGIASIPLEERARTLGFAPEGDAVYVVSYVGWDSTVLRRLTLSDPSRQQLRKIDGYGVLIPGWN